MTKINRMVMKGFKSFGKKVELVFGEDFNCVLGPNGSGKSNILDSLCFVLGKGSAKGLRAEKAANLVYNGGKKKNPAKEGEVSIFFCNKKKTFPTDDEEIKITRIIKKTGISVYKINDERRTKQQILDLLAIANIEPDGYNIILQGDIVRLIEMSAVERRYIIEDIAGISVYEEKKNKALRELDKVESKVGEAEIILGERKTYLKDLKKDRDQALKYKDVADKLKKSKATYNHIQIENREKKKEKTNKLIEKYTEEIDKVNKQIEDMKQLIETKKKEIEDIKNEIEEKGEKEQVQIMKTIEQLKIDIATNKTRMSSNENEINRVIERKKQLQSSLAEIDEKINELNTNKSEFETRKNNIDKNILLINSKIKTFKTKHKIEDSNSMDNDMDNLDKAADDKQKEIQDLREEQQNLLREKDKIELYMGTVDEKISKVLEVEKEHKSEIEKLKVKKNEFKKVTLELNTFLNDDSSHAAQLANAKDKLNSASSDLSKIKNKNSGIQQKLMDNIATKSILDSNNKFGEVFGTISDLGKVSSKYSFALEIAAGARIKSIVVDNDRTASNCIKHLKKNKLGTATFLPLNKIKSSEKTIDPAMLKSNGVYGLAIDLIDYEPKLKNAFKYVFGNTLVIQDIDVGRRISIGSARMVTLDGDLVELSGAMHGGFRQRKRGIGFQEKEVVQELKEKEKTVMDMESLVGALESKRGINEEKIERYRKLKAELEGEIIKGEKSLHLDSDDLEANKKEKTSYKDQLSIADKKAFEVQNKLSGLVRELTEIKVKKQTLRDKINQMRSPTLLAELNTFEQKLTEEKEELIRVESSIKNANMQTSNILLPEKENIVKILTQHDKEEEDFKNQNNNLKDKVKTQGKNLVEKEAKQKKFYGKYKGLFVKKDKLNEELQKTETKTIRLEEGIRRTEQRSNVLSVDNASVKAELAGLYEEQKRYEDQELFKGKTEDELKRSIWQMERTMEQAGNINMRALEVYDQIEKEYNSLIEKKNSLLSEKEEVLIMINEIETKKKDKFMKAFEVIDENFQNMFEQLTTKGSKAFLELENPKDPLSEGLRIKVRITGKKFLDIRSLSGGEKTLTALAFIFAIQEHEPASFYVLDEVDAALDKKNSEKLAEMIENYSKTAQYIMISHNDNIISKASMLYGTSMDEHGMSKVISLKI
jgi:chromosome segregation protein